MSHIHPSEWQVHITHCCAHHGCKYGNEDCPVATGLAKQRYLCEACRDFPDEAVDLGADGPSSTPGTDEECPRCKERRTQGSVDPRSGEPLGGAPNWFRELLRWTEDEWELSIVFLIVIILW